MAMPENLVFKKRLFLTLFGKCCSIWYKTGNVTNFEVFGQNVVKSKGKKIDHKSYIQNYFSETYLSRKYVLKYLEYNVFAEIETFTSQ